MGNPVGTTNKHCHCAGISHGAAFPAGRTRWREARTHTGQRIGKASELGPLPLAPAHTPARCPAGRLRPADYTRPLSRSLASGYLSRPSFSLIGHKHLLSLIQRTTDRQLERSPTRASEGPKSLNRSQKCKSRPLMICPFFWPLNWGSARLSPGSLHFTF